MHGGFFLYLTRTEKNWAAAAAGHANVRVGDHVEDDTVLNACNVDGHLGRWYFDY